MDLYDEFLKGLGETPQQPAIEPLWTVQQDGRALSCVLRYHGKAYGGIEAQILCDGDLRIGRRFDTKEVAVQWAELELEAQRQQRKKGHGRVSRDRAAPVELSRGNGHGLRKQCRLAMPCGRTLPLIASLAIGREVGCMTCGRKYRLLPNDQNRAGSVQELGTRR